MDAPMSLTVTLPSGLVFRDAVRMLKAKFEEWPWARYDGHPPANLNHVHASDVDRVYQLGARTPRAAYLELLRASGPEIDRLLAGIPNEPLEAVDISRHRVEIVGLFDLVLDAKYIKLAGATKLLSPFRPGLLAVVDSVVEYYYWYATSIREETRFRQLSRAKGGEYVYELLCLLREDVIGAREDVDRVLLACAGEPYQAAPRVRVVESLIWYYYARGGHVTRPDPDS